VSSDQRFCRQEILISPLCSLSRRLALPGNVVRTTHSSWVIEFKGKRPLGSSPPHLLRHTGVAGTSSSGDEKSELASTCALGSRAADPPYKICIGVRTNSRGPADSGIPRTVTFPLTPQPSPGIVPLLSRTLPSPDFLSPLVRGGLTPGREIHRV
jgi:hypothetical protein